MSEYKTILEYLQCFIRPGQVSELRAFGEDGGYSGWFDYQHLEGMACAAVKLERTGVCRGIYFCPNPVSPDLLSRRPNQIGPSGRCTTDADILARHWLLIDVDPVRPVGMNSTDEERKHAWTVATQVQTAMSAAGFDEPVIASSGNGWHLSYPVDAPNDESSKEKFRQILIGLDARCSTDRAKVDVKTFNAGRIWKLYGTRARKGPASGERPHRVAFIASPLREITETVRQANTLAISTLLSTWDRQQKSFVALESQRAPTGVSDRARAYLSKVPGAISGQDGHGRTYHVAMLLVEGFALDRETALGLLREWNTTCQPPWSDRELQHKVDSALKNSTNRGYLLREDRPERPDRRAPRYDVRPVYTGPDSVPDEVISEDDPDATAEDLVRLQATVQWTWPGWIQKGTLTCLASDPGIGKTRLCADLTRRVWHAEPWPDGSPATLPAKSRVIWIAADSQWAELGTLPDSFGFPPEAIVLNGRRSNPYVGTNLDSVEDLAEFERRIRRIQPALVFIDTAGNATDRNQGRPEEAKQFFKPLAEIATRNNTSIILVTHLNRGGQVLGNRIVGAVRQVLKLDSPDQTQEDRRRLRVEKTNSQKPPALGVTMGSAGNTYDTDPPTGADDVAPARVVGRPSHLDADMEWMREYLATGAKMVAQTRRDASASGIGASRLYRAKDGLQVVEYEVDGRLWWKAGATDE